MTWELPVDFLGRASSSLLFPGLGPTFVQTTAKLVGFVHQLTSFIDERVVVLHFIQPSCEVGCRELLVSEGDRFHMVVMPMVGIAYGS